jgi:hypothetical protein
MAYWTPNFSTQMPSFDHIETHSRIFVTTLSAFLIMNRYSRTMRLELGELLGSLAASGKDPEDVEADGLGEGPALADDDLVTGLDTEGGRDVCGEVLVALLVTGVLGDEVEVFAADDQGAYYASVCVAKANFDILSRRLVRNIEAAEF